jgi:hypothetical protein
VVKGARHIVPDQKGKCKCTILTVVKHQIKESVLQGVDGNVSIMKSKGLGDTVEKITKATGIKTVVDKVSEGLNIPCGCAARKAKLNQMFPYKK